MFGNTPKLTLGRVKGIPVRVDATFAVVPLAFVLALPAQASQTAWAAAAVATLGVFLSIFLHEAGHALTAKVQQVGVSEIVVGGFFGYAGLKSGAIPRKSLIRILAAGPLTNLAIFLALWLVLALSGLGLERPTGATVPPDWWSTMLRAVALINLAMFAFNSLPAYPLDGGRILGLALDRRLTQRASLRIVSILGIAAGLAMVVLGLGINAILMAIGAFIVLANLQRMRSLARARKPS